MSKKLWIALLSLGLVFAFSLSVSALDVKFSGSYYVEGVWTKNWSLLDPDTESFGTTIYGTKGSSIGPKTGPFPANAIGSLTSFYEGSGSQGLYFTRTRIQTDFKVAEGLTLVTRFDFLEKKWGDHTWSYNANVPVSVSYDTANRNSVGAVNARAQENVEFERAYIDFTTAIGRFLIGYQQFGTWGTVFIDTSFTRPGIKYFIPLGSTFTLGLAYDKQWERENNYFSAAQGGMYSDIDKDEYYIYFWGKGQVVEAGFLLEYMRDAGNKALATYNNYNPNYYSSAIRLFLFDPYIKATFGPVYVEAEGLYGWGKLTEFDNEAEAYMYPGGSANARSQNRDVAAWGLYLHAKADVGPVYFGGIFAVLSGDDPATYGKQEGGLTSLSNFQAGQDWSPTLIWKNDDHATQFGGLNGGVQAFSSSLGYYSTGTNQFMDNAWFYQIYVGVKPTARMDFQLKAAYMYADKKPWLVPASGPTNPGFSWTEYNSDKYGWEVDFIADFKIYDNLVYRIGAGYFGVGDYYKGYDPLDNVHLKDNYLLMHRLTLSF